MERSVRDLLGGSKTWNTGSKPSPSASGLFIKNVLM